MQAAYIAAAQTHYYYHDHGCRCFVGSGACFAVCREQQDDGTVRRSMLQRQYQLAYNIWCLQTSHEGRQPIGLLISTDVCTISDVHSMPCLLQNVPYSDDLWVSMNTGCDHSRRHVPPNRTAVLPHVTRFRSIAVICQQRLELWWLRRRMADRQAVVCVAGVCDAARLISSPAAVARLEVQSTADKAQQ